MAYLKNNKKAFVSLLGLFLAIVIIFFIGYRLYNTYLGKPSADKENQKFFLEHGIDTSSQVNTFESTKQKIRDVNKTMQDRENQISDMLKQ